MKFITIAFSLLLGFFTLQGCTKAEGEENKNKPVASQSKSSNSEPANSKANALKDAIEANDIRKAKQLLQQGANPNASVNSVGSSVIYYAIDKQNPELLQVLLENNANPNQKNKANRTPLTYASQRNNLEAVKLLLANKADINSVGEYGNTPLFNAVLNNNEAMLEEVLRHKPTTINNKWYTEDSALYVSILNNNPKILQRLLELKPEVEQRDISEAMKYGNPEVIDPLLSYVNEHYPTLKETIYTSVNPKLKALADKYRFTTKPLLLKTVKTENPLVKYSSDFCRNRVNTMQRCSDNFYRKLNQRGHDGKTPLIRAIENNQYDEVKYYIKEGAKLDIADSKGRTPLMYAVQNDNNPMGSYRIAELLVEKGAPINQRNSQGATALYYLEAGVQDALFKLLLDNKADPNINMKDGRTIIEMALRGEPTKEFGTVNLLLSHGAKVKSPKTMSPRPYETAILARIVVNNAWRAQLQKLNQALLKAIPEEYNPNYDLPKIKELLAQGANPNTTYESDSNTPPLFNAIGTHSNELADLLIKHNANIRAENNYGANPITISAETNNLEYVRKLLEKGVDVDTKGLGNTTVLYAAVMNNNIEMLKEAVKYQTKSVNSPNDYGYGYTPLRFAITAGNPEMVIELLKLGAKPDNDDLAWAIHFDDRDIITPLLLKAKERKLDPSNDVIPISPETETLLIKHGFYKPQAKNMTPFSGEIPDNINTIGEDGKTALIRAIESRDVAQVKALLTAGADPDQADKRSITPLMHSVGYGFTLGKNSDERKNITNYMIAKLLLDNGADINATDRHKRNALFYLEPGVDNGFAKLLLDNDADPNIIDKNENSVLLEIISNNDIEKNPEGTMHLYMQYGAKIHDFENLIKDAGGTDSRLERVILRNLARQQSQQKN